MSTLVVGPTLENKSIAPRGLAFRTSLFVLFLACGLAVFILGCNYFVIFPTNQNLFYNVLVSAALLVAAVWLKRDERLNKYWPIAFAFFVGSIAFPISLLFAGWDSALLSWFNLTKTTSQGLAFLKVREMLVICIPTIVLIKLSGADLGSIYLKRGNLKWGLSIGALVFFNLTASAFLFFATRYTSVDKLGAAVVWGLVFAFANGFMEELWLRGIFLKRFQPLLGVGGAVLLTSIVFALMHGGALYLTPVAIPFMVANTFTLGLACGYLMIKTDSIWGPTLIHAAADLFLFFAMLANA
ncbi:MAG: type II CAAX endopeptidase family protein [Anaerolineae bacterium]